MTILKSHTHGINKNSLKHPEVGGLKLLKDQEFSSSVREFQPRI